MRVTAEKVLVSECCQQPEVALCRIVHSCQKTIDHLRLEGPVDDEIGIAFARRKPTVESMRSLKSADNSRSNRNDSPT